MRAELFHDALAPYNRALSDSVFSAIETCHRAIETVPIPAPEATAGYSPSAFCMALPRSAVGNAWSCQTALEKSSSNSPRRWSACATSCAPAMLQRKQHHTSPQPEKARPSTRIATRHARQARRLGQNCTGEWGAGTLGTVGDEIVNPSRNLLLTNNLRFLASKGWGRRPDTPLNEEPATPSRRLGFGRRPESSLAGFLAGKGWERSPAWFAGLGMSGAPMGARRGGECKKYHKLGKKT